ncbi:MAG: type I-C CRISPR-associated protein Cas7/Csd2 [Propionibacteriaceae bacterium]|jgi:CRISPR-associated protein Csd2|nr:type I-C CRISPR-associated protein Cas7/Csd2 [Propionibacteriaceae bacterium]
MYTDPTMKHDALLMFDVVDSNPNGDPDNAGKPRTDLDTGQGLVSDVSLKRKVRDTVQFQVEQGILRRERNEIFIRRGVSLNELEATEAKSVPTNQRQEYVALLKEKFFDVRMFGAVLTGSGGGGTAANRVTGPVTFGIARSVDPVLPSEFTITRVASTKEKDRDNASQMGSKTVIPYGLYAARIHYQPTRDNQVTADDLRVFWDAVIRMFELTRSAARPDIQVRGLFVFTHDNPLGNAPAHRLLELVGVSKNPGVETPTAYSDYTVTEPAADNLPTGVTYTRLV